MLPHNNGLTFGFLINSGVCIPFNLCSAIKFCILSVTIPARSFKVAETEFFRASSKARVKIPCCRLFTSNDICPPEQEQRTIGGRNAASFSSTSFFIVTPRASVATPEFLEPAKMLSRQESKIKTVCTPFLAVIFFSISMDMVSSQ